MINKITASSLNEAIKQLKLTPSQIDDFKEIDVRKTVLRHLKIHRFPIITYKRHLRKIWEEVKPRRET